jgi:adenine-specific DNA-methyltransferase
LAIIKKFTGQQMTHSSTLPTKLSLETTPLSEARLEDLKTLFPEAFVEGQLNIEALVCVLGLKDDELTETKRESFGLHWVGKEEAKRQSKKGTQWTLMPCPEETESLNWDTTQNLVIEADNLVALKLLVKSYAGKVDMIYIDPPYNCKADTLYNDDYSEDQSIYRKRAGLVDDEGNQLSTIKNKGHEHSLWLSMMYPRLQLMKRLLKSGGQFSYPLMIQKLHI